MKDLFVVCHGLSLAASRRACPFSQERTNYPSQKQATETDFHSLEFTRWYVDESGVIFVIICDLWWISLLLSGTELIKKSTNSLNGSVKWWRSCVGLQAGLHVFLCAVSHNQFMGKKSGHGHFYIFLLDYYNAMRRWRLPGCILGGRGVCFCPKKKSRDTPASIALSSGVITFVKQI